jgi:hypothetical protein
MGLNFYDYDGLQPKITPPKHISRQCMYEMTRNMIVKAPQSAFKNIKLRLFK